MRNIVIPDRFQDSRQKTTVNVFWRFFLDNSHYIVVHIALGKATLLEVSMVSRLHRKLNLLLLLLLIAGAAVAGPAVELSGCTGERTVIDCCDKMACCSGDVFSHTTDADNGEAGCSHKGLCADNGLLLPVLNDRCIVDTTNFTCLPALSPDFVQDLSLVADPSPVSMVNLVPEKAPPLYIRNCSFLC